MQVFKRRGECAEAAFRQKGLEAKFNAGLFTHPVAGRACRANIRGEVVLRFVFGEQLIHFAVGEAVDDGSLNRRRP